MGMAGQPRLEQEMRFPGLRGRLAWRCGVALLCAWMAAPSSSAARIKDLCEVQGARGNDLMGVGIVVGLAGTGDKVPEAVRAQQRMLERSGIEVGDLGNLKSDNAAIVMVTGVFPPFAKEGTRIDVSVSSLFDCETLQGGILMNTYLKGIDDEVYVVAHGPVSIGGFSAGRGGTGVQQNHPTVGQVPMGGIVEREIPSTITDGERIALTLKRPDFATASNICAELNQLLGEGMAQAYGAGTINVRIPQENQGDLVSFIARLQEVTVESGLPARVVINERTGTVVVGAGVAVKPCQVAHGNLTIEIAVTPFFPAAPMVGTEEREGELTDVTVREPDAALMPVQGTSAGEVALALNKLKVTPRDLIAIFQALRKAGALEADLEIM